MLVPWEVTYAKEGRSVNASPHKCGSQVTLSLFQQVFNPFSSFAPPQPCHICRVLIKLLCTAMPVRKMHFLGLYKLHSCLQFSRRSKRRRWRCHCWSRGLVIRGFELYIHFSCWEQNLSHWCFSFQNSDCTTSQPCGGMLRGQPVSLKGILKAEMLLSLVCLHYAFCHIPCNVSPVPCFCFTAKWMWPQLPPGGLMESTPPSAIKSSSKIHRA